MRVELTNTDFADLRSTDEHPIRGGSANTIIFATLFHFYAVAAVLTYKFNSSLAPTLGLEPKSTVFGGAVWYYPNPPWSLLSKYALRIRPGDRYATIAPS